MTPLLRDVMQKPNALGSVSSDYHQTASRFPGANHPCPF